MKAEHRKELQTNILADRMGRLVQGMKLGGPKPTSLVLWVLAGLALGTVLFYWYYSGSVRSSRSHLWFAVEQEVNNTNDPAKAMERLGTLAADHPGSMPALIARLQRARLLEQAGLERLYSSDPFGEDLVKA